MEWSRKVENKKRRGKGRKKEEKGKRRDDDQDAMRMRVRDWGGMDRTDPKKAKKTNREKENSAAGQ